MSMTIARPAGPDARAVWNALCRQLDNLMRHINHALPGGTPEVTVTVTGASLIARVPAKVSEAQPDAVLALLVTLNRLNAIAHDLQLRLVYPQRAVVMVHFTASGAYDHTSLEVERQPAERVA